MFTKSIFHKKKISRKIIILIVLLTLFLMPIINGLTGEYSLTSPFSCGTNCSGGYELSGHDATYCNANPIECYNTIDNCKDGDKSSYEYVENITITNLDGTNFTGGDTINIDAYIDCDSDGDKVSFIYSNGTGFVNKNDVTCTVNGKTHKYYNLTLDDFTGNHTVRIVIAYAGSNGVTCGEQSTYSRWSDTDDVTFYVYGTPDTTPPTVEGALPVEGTIYQPQAGLQISICANISDNVDLDYSYANVTWNGKNELLEMDVKKDPLYCGYFVNTTYLGMYNVTYIVNDGAGNTNDTTMTYFNIEATTNISVNDPIQYKLYPYDPIPLNFSIEGNFEIETVFYSIDSESNISLQNANVNLSFVQTDINGSRGENNSEYHNLSMSFKPINNMSVEIISISLKRNSSGTNNASLQIRSDNNGVPSTTILAEGNINNNSVSTNYSFVNITLNSTIDLISNTSYWLFLSPNSSNPNFYYWESNDDNNYSDGNYSNNASTDLLFIIYDKYNFKTQLTNISIGEHSIIVYANSSNETISSTEIDFEIDSTAPIVNNISYVPLDAEELDPGTIINFTLNVTDNLAVDTVLIQYKKENDSIYLNSSTINSSEIYTGNFTPDSEGIWVVRIYSNDSSNNAASTSLIYLNISTESSWSINPSSFNSSSATLNSNTTIGNLSVSNTGDSSYSFNITKTGSTISDVYFNDSLNTLLLDINSNSNASIPIIVTGLAAESEQIVGIIVDALNSSASPNYISTNFTFITYSSGPYLDLSITEYDSTVTQEQTRITLEATITNVGNETANNVYSYWNLPSGWSAKTNLTYNISSLAVGEQTIFSRQVSIDSDASTGQKTISIYVNSSEGAYNSENKNVIVSSLEDETPSTSSNSGGGSGRNYIAPAKPNLEILIENEIEIEVGKNITINGILKNTGQTILNNLKLELNEFPILYQNITGSFDEIKIGENKSFSIFIQMPNYYSSGKINSNLIVKDQNNNNNTYEKEITIIAVTNEKSSALECFTEAEKNINKSSELKIGVLLFNNKLEEARNLYSDKYYLDALILCQEIVSKSKLAQKLKEQINSINKRYDSLKDNYPELQELIKLTEEAFEREEYVLANQRAEQTDLLLKLKEEEIKQSAGYKLTVLKNNIIQILSGIIIIGVIGIFSVASKNLKLINKKLIELEQKNEIIKSSINNTQKKYFIHKRMSRKQFDKEIDRHKNELAKNERKKIELRIKKLKIVSGRDKKDLLKIKAQAQKEKDNLQQKYFIEKSIDNETFRKYRSSYETALVDINQKIEFANARKLIKEKKNELKKK